MKDPRCGFTSEELRSIGQSYIERPDSYWLGEHLPHSIFLYNRHPYLPEYSVLRSLIKCLPSWITFDAYFICAYNFDSSGIRDERATTDGPVAPGSQSNFVQENLDKSAPNQQNEVSNQ
jgi:hypothetical protein